MHPVETYLKRLREIRRTGHHTPEVSFYGALEELLNEAGKKLKPRVIAVMTLANKGAGLPDGGLFITDQLSDYEAGSTMPPNPARGVIEVKPVEDDAWVTASGRQVSRYWGKYRQVLVTNYRDFVLVGQNAEGQPRKLESFRLADSVTEFWDAATTPRRTDGAQGDRFLEFLRRVLLHAAPIATPQDLAWYLASYAREAAARAGDPDFAALAGIRTALEEGLGVRFEGARGDHFFRSTLVQTLFYGVFSAWVLWSKQTPPTATSRFEWHDAIWYLHVPVISTLFHQIATPATLRTSTIEEVLNWTGDVLNRVDRPSFFERFEEGQAVQYFYEPFLQAFDPELRKQLGVWYTPPEVVRYMVARVDAALRDELGVADGLADPNVYVLDPCCGTGSYLVEVLNRVAKTLKAKGGNGLLAYDLKQAARTRVFGFEILPAPFVVAHLQLGLLLQNYGAPLGDDGRERAAVYLTNALTGWRPDGTHVQLLLPELGEERDAANNVKRKAPILVVLGNPPYNGFAGVAVEEERELSQAYRRSRRTRQPQGQGLNDLYVRFFRMAERRIVEQTGRGIVCLISNYSWLDGLSFTAMRERYLEVFDQVWIDNLNGDKYKTGKLTPEGLPDPSIFSTEWNREGIQVGTAIATLVRKQDHADADTVRFRNLWGRNKRADLLATPIPTPEGLFEPTSPQVELGFPFMPMATSAGYFAWPSLPDLLPRSFPGVKTSRDDVVVDIDRDRLVARMERYFDPAVLADQMRRIAPGAMESTSRFPAKAVREALQKRGFLRKNIVRYCYRPFDLRWMYWDIEEALLDRPRPEYFPQVFEGNVWIVSQQKPRREWSRPQVIHSLGCIDLMDRSATCLPLYARESPTQALGESEVHETRPNLTPGAVAYLKALDRAPAEDLFFHIVAVLHAPEYACENAGALRQDWPRVPLPNSRKALEA